MAIGGTVLKKHSLRDEAVEAVDEVDGHHAADVAGRDDAALVAEHVVHEGVEVDGVGAEVVDVVGGDVAVAVARAGRRR